MNSFNEVVELVTERIYERDPSLHERYGERGKVKCREDNHHHFKHLQTAYELNDVKVFTDYAVWLEGILTKHGMTAQHLIDNFNLIQGVLRDMTSLEPHKKQQFSLYLSEAVRVLEGEA